MLPVRVDFYLTSKGEDCNRELFTCRLIEKAYLKGHRIFVFCDDEVQAHSLDELLWTFRDDSFVPHNLQGEGPEPPPPVQIGFSTQPRQYTDILVNFSENIPEFCHQFKRIIEIVGPEEEEKEQSRAHYKFYKARGYELHTHNLPE